MSNLEDYLRVAWQDHAARPQSVAESFADGMTLLAYGGQSKFPDLARLIEHTLLAHIGAAGLLQHWIDELHRHSPDDLAARVALQRIIFANTVSLGAQAQAPDIPDDQQLSGCANGLVAHCVGGDGTAALRWLVQYAQELCHTPKGRAKAIAGAMNSLSFHLGLFKPEGVAREVMVAAAVLSRDAWSRLGAWRDIERAEQFLALTYVEAGQGAQALAHVDRCRSLCEQNAAPPYEFAMAEDACARAALALNDAALFRGARQRLQELLGGITDATAHAHALSRLRELDALCSSRVAEPLAEPV
jgi:hypothetical protein